ncbi:hypothetical protein V2G26_019809 [Clonostachys chloroleuca]
MSGDRNTRFRPSWQQRSGSSTRQVIKTEQSGIGEREIGLIGVERPWDRPQVQSIRQAENTIESATVSHTPHLGRVQPLYLFTPGDFQSLFEK